MSSAPGGLMALLSGEGPASRTELLEKASKYRAKGKLKKAIVAYKKVLEEDADDHEVHARVAPLLAQTGEPGGAMASFRTAAEGFMRRGFVDKAIAVYRQAVESVPHDERAWDRLADLYLAKERPKDAVTTLLDGRRRYKKAYDRPRAIRLLRRALGLEPLNVAVAIDLARQLKKNKEREESRAILEHVVEQLEGKPRRRVRRALLRLYPSPRTFWRWLARR